MSARLGTFVPCIVLFAVALLVYRANDGFLYTYDSAPASLFAFNALQHHTFAFDAFRNGYFYGFGAGYIFAEAPNGHLAPVFPIGTALLAAPLFAVDYVRASLAGPFPDITVIAFEPSRLRYEKDAASIVGAVAVALAYLCARRLGSSVVAALVTIAFAFGSEMWTIGSQALWQHGAVDLGVLAMTYALLREIDAKNARGVTAWLAVAGVCAGFLPVIRPTAGAFLLGGLGFALWHRRGNAWPFVAGMVLGIAPGIVWNVAVFHSLVGGYATNEGAYGVNVRRAIVAFFGLAFSPSRGLLVFTPWVAFSAVGALRALRAPGARAKLLVFLAFAGVIVYANYLFFTGWIGGSSFGPRYLADVAAVCALLLVYVIPDRLRMTQCAPLPLWAAAAFVVALCYSIGVQIAGANGEPKSNWSDLPVSAADHPERVWRISDSQIERDARTIDRLWRGSPTFTTAYAPGFRGRIVDVRGTAGSLDSARTLTLRPGGSTILTGVAENVGTSVWYGYESGVYFGQARIRARIYGSDGAESGETYLFIATTTAPGGRATAIGTLRAPTSPGTYVVDFDVDCFQVAGVNNGPDAPPVRVTLAVRRA